MGIARKGSRRIVVDDLAYRWKYNDFPSRNLVVELHDDPRSVLTVRMRDRNSVNELLDELTEPVTPGQVADLVRSAIEEGWDPHSTAPFELD